MMCAQGVHEPAALRRGPQHLPLGHPQPASGWWANCLVTYLTFFRLLQKINKRLLTYAEQHVELSIALEFAVYHSTRVCAQLPQ